MKTNLQIFLKRLCSLIIVVCAVAASKKAETQARDMIEPGVMLLFDTSGSMDWRDDTNRTPGLGQWEWSRLACEAHGTDNKDRTSWQKLQDVFLGKLTDYKCAVHEPDQRPDLHALRDDGIENYVPENIAEYQGVSYPHFRSLSCPAGMWNEGQCIDASSTDITVVNKMTKCYNDDVYVKDGSTYCLNMHPEASPRQLNGILNTFGSSVRFGAMTLDNMPKCWENCASTRHATRWDYGHYRHWRCGGIDNVDSAGTGDICYDWNAGGRGGKGQGYVGAVGGMVGIGTTAESTNAQVAKLLNSVEPLYCSPVGSLLDDTGYYFAKEPNVLPLNMGGTDPYYRCRPKIALLFSDGQPTSVFEFAAGSCNIGETDESEWDPLTDARKSHNDYGPPFANPDTKIFNCPWRSTPEEAGELFDVGNRILKNIDVAECTPPSCWPVLLVVVGFNVPDIDCSINPESCYKYTPEYVPCWNGIAKCEADPEALPGETTYCMMSPRQFLNETACQGWPWNPAEAVNANYGPGGVASRVTTVMPPWLSEENAMCGDASEEGNFICRKLSADIVERALFVETPDQMAEVLDLLLVEMTASAATRTDLVVWNSPSVKGFDLTAEQFEFRTGYVPKSGRAWKGVFTRKDWTCKNRDEDASENVHNIAQMINDQGKENRNILSYYTHSPEYAFALSDLNNTSITKWLDQDAVSGGLKDIKDGEFDDCAFGVGDILNDPDICSGQTLASSIIKEETLSRGLADIYNSTPAVLGPPYDRLNFASYKSYRNDGNASRSPYIFVGTNDGVLHAVDVDQISEAADPKPEKWGFIPKSLLKELRYIYPVPDIVKLGGGGYTLDEKGSSGVYRHLFLMDGPPVARDALLIRKADQFDLELETLAWRAVVFGNSGRNARTHFALDVTKTLKKDSSDLPVLRWEINPDSSLYGNNDDDGKAALDYLGMPVSRSALAYVRESVGNTNEKAVVAAAIIPGGWKANPDPNAADQQQNGNTGVYLLRLADGKVIRYLDPKKEEDICPNSLGLIHEASGSDEVYWDGAQLIGEPVVPHGTRSLNVTTHAFIGDDRGRLWIIDLYDEDPEKWCLNIYFDSLISWHYPYEDCVDSPGDPCSPSSDCVWEDCCRGSEAELPCSFMAQNMKSPRSMIIGAPSIAQDENSKDVLVFGTGQYDELTSWNRNRIFSLTNNTTMEEVQGKVRVVHTPTINWWVGDAIPSTNSFGDLPSSESGIAAETMLSKTESEMASKYVALSDFPRDGDAPEDFWNVGEKLIGRPVVFDETAYFTTYSPLTNRNTTKDACDDFGASRVWALDYKRYDSEAADTDKNFIGKFYTGEKWITFHNYPSELLSGVKVVKRPSCDPNEPPVFELVVQKANPSSNGAQSGGVPGADAVQTMSIPITKPNPRGFVTVRFDSWSIVF